MGRAQRDHPRRLSPRPCPVWINSIPGKGWGEGGRVRTVQRPGVISLGHGLGVRIWFSSLFIYFLAL